MKIRIRKEGWGYCVDKHVGSYWKHWLPKAYATVRGEELYDYYKTPKEAENAARQEKEKMEGERDIILEI